ncbi:MAG: hypothetical protein H8D56_26915 [Planctomycetes bacterium]|nr:hypothetical protein [Planctomycetota bacterium]
MPSSASGQGEGMLFRWQIRVVPSAGSVTWHATKRSDWRATCQPETGRQD